MKWCIDYLWKASVRCNCLYVQAREHKNAENYANDRLENSGTEIAAHTSTTMAAASIVFCGTDHSYSPRLLNKAKQLFQFAKSHKGTYDGECLFYCSFSGYVYPFSTG
ncbi:hypothetical protein H5410_022739 [Solanum commersonii]|uniref:cellulase n=1 Tax=Solanum commersonii TaxID=4109 RepID=A0A9J5ZFM1_SOLCO|nr:hypothetical protein H5410_022739 [Solanum commersonii]